MICLLWSLLFFSLKKSAQQCLLLDLADHHDSENQVRHVLTGRPVGLALKAWECLRFKSRPSPDEFLSIKV